MSLVSVFLEFSASINKALILACGGGDGGGGGGWVLDYHSMGFRHFPDISPCATHEATHIYYAYK